MFLYFADEMLGDDLPQTRVELLPTLAEHHGVGVPVQLFKAQVAVVLSLDHLEGILQKLPDVVCVPLFQHNLAKTNRHRPH